MAENTARAAFEAAFPMVSHEAREKLAIYAKMLAEWSERMNLVASSTLDTVWTRHFGDSAQLVPFLPEKKRVLFDLGSGAGFPGLVLALLTDHEIHLVESIGKKAVFLQAVADELKVNVTVHACRAEALSPHKADIVTARAVSALPGLLDYAKRLLKKDGFCLFLKGEKLDAELTEALKSWTFEAEKKRVRATHEGLS